MFRILSLDGGGIRGTFTAAVLVALEEATGKSVAEHFDLITGTSTGAGLAIGLGLGLSTRQLLEFYRENGPVIFPRSSVVIRSASIFRELFRPKHSQEVLKEALVKMLGNRKFGESARRLVLPAYDANAGRIYLFKTAHKKEFTHDINAPAAEVALATSAAPRYFAATPFPAHEGSSYVDGGVWANCPALVGIIEAISFLGQKADDIDVLSIGTTTEPFNIARYSHSGIIGWNKGIVDLMFAAQMDAALAQSKLLTNGRLHRINFTTLPRQYPMADARPEVITRLMGIGRGEAVKRENLAIVSGRFMNGEPAAPFVPTKTLVTS